MRFERGAHEGRDDRVRASLESGALRLERGADEERMAAHLEGAWLPGLVFADDPQR